MYQYAILIYENESDLTASTPDEQAGLARDHAIFRAAIRASVCGGYRLRPSYTATSVRRAEETDLVTDGSFIGSPYVLGGWYLIEAPDLDEALSIAKGVPAARGGVETRPLWLEQP